MRDPFPTLRLVKLAYRDLHRLSIVPLQTIPLLGGNAVLHSEYDKSSLPDNRINTLFIRKNGNIVAGTVVGICELDRQTKKFTRFLISSKDSILLSGRAINVIYKDRNEIFWIGTSLGLIKVNPVDGRCAEYLPDENDPNSISSNIINSIIEDHRGNLWIGTDKGLNNLDRKNNSFTLFTTRNGLPSDYISGIEVDEDGNLWLSTVRGISRFSPLLPTGSQFRNYDTDDGLQGLEFVDGSSFKNKKGEIFFGGTNGFNKFNPSEIKDNPKQPEVAITAFYLFGKPKLTYFQILDTESITLGYNENFFSFEFNAFDYTNPEKNQYAYQLEGFDKDWVEIGNRRFASYTNIDPGEYTFHVKASNNDGVWNETGTSISIIIKPPFYRTWLAYIFYIAFVVVALYTFRRYELKKRRVKNELILKEEREKSKLTEAQLRAEKAELQALALDSEKKLEEQKIRARIASDLHDEIGSNLSSISLMSELIQKDGKIDQEAYEKIQRIQKVAKGSSQAMRDIVWLTNPFTDNIKDLVSKMNEVANDMLGNINWEFDFPPKLKEIKLIPEVKRNIFFIYKESLNNIYRHANAKLVKISLEVSNDKMFLRIKDNGKGFNTSTAFSGNGLKNLRSRAKEINAELNVESSQEGGTSINLFVNITQLRD